MPTSWFGRSLGRDELLRGADWGWGWRGGCGFLLRLLDWTRCEFETDFAVWLFDQECREGTVVFLGNEFLQQIGPADRTQQLRHLLTLDGTLQDDFPGAIIAGAIGAGGLLANIVHTVLENSGTALWAGT